MARWLTYLKERFPLIVYFLLSAGLALSGASLGGGRELFGPRSSKLSSA